MRALPLFATALLLLGAGCESRDALGRMTLSRADETGAPPQTISSSSCVLSVAASRHRPNGVYVYAELPLGPSALATLEMDVDEAGGVEGVTYREQAGATETFRSEAAQGTVTLLGPPSERTGELDLEVTQGTAVRHLKGWFSRGEGTPLAPTPPPTSSGGEGPDVTVDTSGCDSSEDTSDSEGCSGSGEGDTSSEGCDGSGSGGADSCGGSTPSGCSGDAQAAHVSSLGGPVRGRRPLGLRIFSWVFPYAAVAVFVRAWRRRLRRPRP